MTTLVPVLHTGQPLVAKNIRHSKTSRNSAKWLGILALPNTCPISHPTTRKIEYSGYHWISVKLVDHIRWL